VRKPNTDKLLADVPVQGEIIQTSVDRDSEESLRRALAAAGSR